METKQIIDKVVLGQGLEYNYLGTVSPRGFFSAYAGFNKLADDELLNDFFNEAIHQDCFWTSLGCKPGEDRLLTIDEMFEFSDYSAFDLYIRELENVWELAVCGSSKFLFAVDIVDLNDFVADLEQVEC